ncbi:MAG: hypothetical protein WBB17_15365 [Saprospiraceae bacterium]
MKDLHRMLELQEFKSEDELKNFINNLMGKEIPSFPPEALRFDEQAQDLVLEAYDLPLDKARINIQEALRLDSNCIEAFEYLGNNEPILEIAIVFFEKGISIGRQLYGGKYLKEHKGMFWGLHETRPFMRCLLHYSNLLYVFGRVIESINIMEEMIELNPNDNQGIRDQLMLYLIEIGEYKKFEKYSKMFNDDSLAFAHFNRALFAFKKDGENEKSNHLLLEALKANKFVAAKIISKKPIQKLSSYYGIGDKNEADYYTYFAQHIWQKTNGAIAWITKHSAKTKK